MINKIWLDPKHENDESSKIIEIMSLLNATKHIDVTEIANERKEFIFEKIENRIDEIPTKKMSFWRFKYFKGIAAIGIICILSGSIVSSFTLGKHIRERQLMQTHIQLKSPEGTRSCIELQDGTKITLNGGSVLTYPVCFSSEKREVKLHGEGYFNVAKEENRPFIVETSNLDVHVLGTVFNLCAYPKDEKVILTLESGKVEALIKGNLEERIVLTPNQQLSVIKSSGEFSKSNVNGKYFSSWINGEFYFRGITFREIAMQLERYFNVEIFFREDWLAQERYFSQFDNQENINQILDLLSYKNHWTYQMNGKKIEISEISNDK